MVDQNLQAAQAVAVLNQPPPPPPQNPDEPPANPQNAAAEEVTLDLCLFFFVLSLFCFATRVVFIAAFSSFSSRVVMPCFVTYSFIVTVLRTKLNFLSGFFFFFCRSYTLLISLAANVELYSPLSTLPQNVLFCSFGGNLGLYNEYF